MRNKKRKDAAAVLCWSSIGLLLVAVFAPAPAAEADGLQATTSETEILAVVRATPPGNHLTRIELSIGTIETSVSAAGGSSTLSRQVVALAEQHYENDGSWTASFDEIESGDRVSTIVLDRKDDRERHMVVLGRGAFHRNDLSRSVPYWLQPVEPGYRCEPRFMKFETGRWVLRTTDGRPEENFLCEAIDVKSNGIILVVESGASGGVPVAPSFVQNFYSTLVQLAASRGSHEIPIDVYRSRETAEFDAPKGSEILAVELHRKQ